jgi:hypothetical protein
MSRKDNDGRVRCSQPQHPKNTATAKPCFHESKTLFQQRPQVAASLRGACRLYQTIVIPLGSIQDNAPKSSRSSHHRSATDFTRS